MYACVYFSWICFKNKEGITTPNTERNHCNSWHNLGSPGPESICRGSRCRISAALMQQHCVQFSHGSFPAMMFLRGKKGRQEIPSSRLQIGCHEMASNALFLRAAALHCTSWDEEPPLSKVLRLMCLSTRVWSVPEWKKCEPTGNTLHCL